LPGARAALERRGATPTFAGAPARGGDVGAAAEEVRRLALDAGAADAAVVACGGAPAVIAHWPAPPGTPTVLLYAHADVQPPGPVEQWTSDPFTPVERAGRLYGRGAADDKAGVAMHLAVLRTFGGRPPVGVTLFIEGEEEIGSPTIARILTEHADALRSDVIVIADSANTAVNVPAFTTSLRGLVDVTVEVRTAGLAVHSGLYGGAFPDALTVLCRLLATLHDAAGEVAVAGLVSGGGAPDADEAQLRADLQAVPGLRTIGHGCLNDRMWLRPSISVLGMDAPSVAGASNILVPRARAKVSLRLAPGDEAGRAMKALADHLTRHVEWGAEVEVGEGAAAEPFALDPAGEVYDLARRAFGDAYGNEAVETGIGGSIPFIAEFARRSAGATVLVTGVGDPQSRWHGIDESLDLAMWGRACLAEALFLIRLAAPGAGA
jgi:acetylornithine deacetylase/succinyl-diaminopimelate desuccinylase-like protein